MTNEMKSETTEKAIFAAGCFWGVEATLQKITGVVKTAVGYTGGHLQEPDYAAVCRGDTGHAEAVEVIFDPQAVTYEELLAAFWQLHDPTQKDRQGPDCGSQYRTAIFYTSPAQQQAAEQSKTAIQQHHARLVVTEITAADKFWLAEEHHQCYVQKRRKFGFF